MTLSNLAKRGAQLASDNSPLILTAFGVVGTVTTAVLSARAGARANLVLIGEDERRLNTMRREMVDVETPTLKEEFLLVWKEFIPPVLSLVGTVTCIICANQIGTRRTAALAAAYSLSEKAASEYTDKVVEHFGKAKEQKVRDEIQQDQMKKNSVGRQEVHVTGGGDDLCYEKFTGRYFYSSMENIKQAMNRVNYDIVQGVYASLSDFYAYLGLHSTGVSDELGWNGDHLMDIKFSTTIADDNRPCIAFEYRVEPVRNYFRVH